MACASPTWCQAVKCFGGRIPHPTDHLVFETITLTRYRVSLGRAVFVGERLYSEKMARIHRTSFDQQRAAFETSSGTPTRRTAPSTA